MHLSMWRTLIGWIYWDSLPGCPRPPQSWWLLQLSWRTKIKKSVSFQSGTKLSFYGNWIICQITLTMRHFGIGTYAIRENIRCIYIHYLKVSTQSIVPVCHIWIFMRCRSNMKILQVIVVWAGLFGAHL